MVDRYGFTLYPKEFVEGLPKPDAEETRPLMMLLRGEHADGEREIERIERWFYELDGPDDRKATLAGNMRSLKSRSFWSGLSELMTGRIFAERKCSGRFEVPVGGLTPDFFVQCHTGHQFVAEVMTAFEQDEYRRMNADLHYVANALAAIRHRVAVFIDEVELPPVRPSLKPMMRRVSAWLDTCRPDEPAELCLTPEEVGLSVELSTNTTRRCADS